MKLTFFKNWYIVLEIFVNFLISDHNFDWRFDSIRARLNEGFTFLSLFISHTTYVSYVSDFIWVWVWVGVCVYKKERERKKERGSFTVVGSLSKHCSSPSFLGKRRASKHSMNFFDGLSKNQLPLQLTEQKHFCRWNKNLWIIGFSCLMVRLVEC